MPTVKLRQDTVKQLPYLGTKKKAQCIYWDESLPAFGVRVYPTRRTYVYSYRAQGRKRLATLGRIDVLTLDHARKKARTYLGQVAGGKDPQADDDALVASGTVKALCKEYIDRHAKAKKRSWKNDQSHLERRVIPKLGARLAASITTDDIARFHSGLGAKYPYAANRVLEIIRKMFNLARTWRRIPQTMINPATGIEDFPERKRRRYVTSMEMPKLAESIEAELNEYARHALWLLILTGLRKTELLNAKWTDIDWEARTLYVGTTKNGEAILAPLSLAAIKRLKKIRRLTDNPYVICGSVPGHHLVNLRAAWKRVRKSAGIEDVRMHDLRRTVGSWLVRDGTSLHLVGSILNHKDQKTTAGYAYFQTEDRTKALDKHGKKVTDIASRRTKTRISREPVGNEIGQPRSYTRIELHQLVWSQPISTVAERLGVSDVGLSKACRRANIPVPTRGYWAKVKAGKLPQQDPLPLPSHANIDQIRIRGRRVSMSEKIP